jgi:polysaccharide pyruvyl transferase WcaK-like protein
MKIGVFGHYGNRNLGDEAIITAVIQHIRLRWPEAAIVGLSVNPDDTGRRYRIPAYPIRYRRFLAANNGGPPAQSAAPSAPALGSRFKEMLKAIPVLGTLLRRLARGVDTCRRVALEIGFLKHSYRVIRELDLLFVSGSNQFLDNYGGPWGFPYTLLKWSALTRLAGGKVVFVSMGAGPLDSRLSQWLVRLTLRKAHYLSFRDAGSQRLLRDIGVRSESSVVPDLAFSLITNDSPSPQNRTGLRASVAINPMPVYDSRYWYFSDAAKYEHYVTTFSRFAAQLIEAGHPVFFFGTHPNDQLVIDDILALLPVPRATGLAGRADLRRYHESVSDLMKTIQSADLIVATRFHGVLLALYAGKPVLGVCYYRKTRELMAQMGQDDYAVDLETMEADDLMRRFRALDANRHLEVPKIENKSREFRDDLDAQYERVFQHLAGDKAATAAA